MKEPELGGNQNQWNNKDDWQPALLQNLKNLPHPISPYEQACKHQNEWD
jgi:hypothetical protein